MADDPREKGHALDPGKANAVRQWSASPAGAHWAAHEQAGSVEFYREVEQTRYALYPWLCRYLEPARWSRRKVLEVGVGLGTDHLMLHRAGAEVTGVDLTPASIEHTRRRIAMEEYAPRVRVADAERLPFAAGEFDGVYSFGVLHHTPDMAQAVREVARVLRPGGRVVVAVYNRRSYFYAWRLTKHLVRGVWRRRTLAEMRAGFEHGEGSPIVVVSSREEILRLFRDAGFRDATVEGRHLPTNRLPAVLRPHVDRLLAPLERRIGWYWMVEATR